MEHTEVPFRTFGQKPSRSFECQNLDRIEARNTMNTDAIPACSCGWQGAANMKVQATANINEAHDAVAGVGISDHKIDSY